MAFLTEKYGDLYEKRRISPLTLMIGGLLIET